jgi:hypothetical protein
MMNNAQSPSGTQPDRAELKKFGITFAMVLAILFGLIIPLIRYGLNIGAWPLWPWMISLSVLLLALTVPAYLKHLHGPWMKFAVVAQWINTRIIMLLLFYVIIFPIGLILRLFGKDSMKRKFETRTASYRIDSDRHEKTQMEKPF